MVESEQSLTSSLFLPIRIVVETVNKVGAICHANVSLHLRFSRVAFTAQRF